MTGIEIALWDILGMAVRNPVCDLLGGRIRESVRVYAHAGTLDRPRSWLRAASTRSSVRRSSSQSS
jgi:galactonate dehydratase